MGMGVRSWIRQQCAEGNRNDYLARRFGSKRIMVSSDFWVPTDKKTGADDDVKFKLVSLHSAIDEIRSRIPAVYNLIFRITRIIRAPKEAVSTSNAVWKV
jgi:hypothetical protein